ncbi:NAD(P)-dependent oxidoreductase [Candidatus Pseudothioglobus singularis]|jgi:nucleoside-diphosphate-sugar epimerase|nr:NAD(P)-dependent oxidoreductase [Candidatus Pseudothioglobus singularis]
MEYSRTKKTIAITGANGFIGKKLITELSKDKNISLRLLVRNVNDSSNLAENILKIEGDLTKSESLKQFLVPNCIVINLAYIFGAKGDENIIAIKNLVKICQENKIERLIHCSTASVFGRVSGNTVSESSICRPYSDYAKTKLMIEELIKEGSKDKYEFVNVRPTEVYGSNGKGLAKLINDLMYGNQILNYVKSCLFNSRTMNLVHVSNVIAAIIFLIFTEKEVAGETYIVSEDDSPLNNYQSVERYLIKRLKLRHYFIPAFPIPLIILSVILRFLKRDSVNPNLFYDPSKIKKIGFKFVSSFYFGLDDISAWHLKNFKEDK